MSAPCSCPCGCGFSARDGECWRCKQGRHRGESQACECISCVCRDANRLSKTSIPGANLMMCRSCRQGRHNLLRKTHAA